MPVGNAQKPTEFRIDVLPAYPQSSSPTIAVLRCSSDDLKGWQLGWVQVLRGDSDKYITNNFINAKLLSPESSVTVHRL